MGQKTHPTGNRLGFIKGWDSNWYGGKELRREAGGGRQDSRVPPRTIGQNASMYHTALSSRAPLKLVTVTIHTARPGVIIGKGGQEVDKLREELKKLTKKESADQHLRDQASGVGCATGSRDAMARQLEGTDQLPPRGIKMSIASFNHANGR